MDDCYMHEAYQLILHNVDFYIFFYGIVDLLHKMLSILPMDPKVPSLSLLLVEYCYSQVDCNINLLLLPPKPELEAQVFYFMVNSGCRPDDIAFEPSMFTIMKRKKYDNLPQCSYQISLTCRRVVVEIRLTDWTFSSTFLFEIISLLLTIKFKIRLRKTCRKFK